MLHFTPARVRRIDTLMCDLIRQEKLFGAVVLLGEGETLCLRKAYGLRARSPAPEPMTPDTWFDVASLTKIIATWPVLMRLLEQGACKLEDTLAELFPDPVHESIAHATLLQLMTHTAGLPERTWARQYGAGMERVARGILQTRASYPPGVNVRYCSRGPILLGYLSERLSGVPFAAAARSIWQEMGMTNTYASPMPPHLRARCAPTERRPDGKIVRGTVHDENAEWLDGMTGHAGAFSTVDDLSRFCRMVLGKGQLEGRRILREESVTHSLRVRTPPGESRRGLLWHIGRLPGHPEGLLYDHLGFTGVGLWLEPGTQTYALLMTNYIHPERKPPGETIKPVRDAFKALCWEP